MTARDWIWMPHAAHFCMGDCCRFHLATYVGGVIVSTVGECDPGESMRELEATARGITLRGRGDARYADWLTRVGFMEIGLERTYETMVFSAVPSTEECCPWRIDAAAERDMLGYSAADDAYRGHLAMCEKWGAV